LVLGEEARPEQCFTDRGSLIGLFAPPSAPCRAKGRPESGRLFQIRHQHLRSISSLRGLGANDVAKLRPWSYHQRMNMSPPSDYVTERRGAFKSAQVNAINESIGVPLMMGE
jgi:hypothetical protein